MQARSVEESADEAALEVNLTLLLLERLSPKDEAIADITVCC
jgi:hypothetical protein